MRKIFYRSFTIILALIVCVCATMPPFNTSAAFSAEFNTENKFEVEGKYIVVDSEGSGTDRDKAMKEAWLEGRRKAVGSFIDSKTELNNNQLTERIIAYSRGFIEKYEVLSVDESKADSGIYKIKVRLWIVQDLLRDGAQHASSGSAEIAFSPEDLIRRQRELDAKAAQELAAKMPLKRPQNKNLIRLRSF